MELFATSIDQTGIVIFVTPNKKEEALPLFSENVIEEAHKLLNLFSEGTIIKNVFVCNNLMKYRIEDMIRDYREANEEQIRVLPEEYMEDLVSGFPFIKGSKKTNTKMCYR